MDAPTLPSFQFVRLTGSDCNRTFGLLLRPEPLSLMGLADFGSEGGAEGAKSL
jgi:hypothetical protein